jgi:hypothetical protein
MERNAPGWRYLERKVSESYKYLKPRRRWRLSKEERFRHVRQETFIQGLFHRKVKGNHWQPECRTLPQMLEVASS